VVASQHTAGVKAVKRDTLRKEKEGKTTAIELRMRVLIRTRKLKLGGGPQLEVWSTKGIVCQVKTDDNSGALRAKVRWLTHGHGEAALPGTVSRWLLASRDLRADESLTAVAHVDTIDDAMARRDRQQRGLGSVETGLRIAIPKTAFFAGKPAQDDYFGRSHEGPTVWGRVGQRSDDGRCWSIFTNFGCVDIPVSKVTQLAEASARGETLVTEDDQARNAKSRLRQKRKKCSEQFQFFAKKKKNATKRAASSCSSSFAVRELEGIQLWPWEHNSCHLDTFLASIVSIQSRTRRLEIDMPSTNILNDSDASLDLARGYYATAKSALDDYELADDGRAHALVDSILDIDRNHFREQLKSNPDGVPIETPDGSGDWRDHHLLLSRPATKTSTSQETKEAFGADFMLRLTTHTWCVRRRVPADSPLLQYLPQRIDRTKFGIGNPACKSREVTRYTVHTTKVIMLDGHKFDPPLPLPGVPEDSMEEFIAPKIRNLWELPSTKLATTEEALRQTLFGGTYTGACQTPDSTSQDAQQCAGATIVMPDLNSRYLDPILFRPVGIFFHSTFVLIIRLSIILSSIIFFPTSRNLFSSLPHFYYCIFYHMFPTSRNLFSVPRISFFRLVGM
jgi:hypothetical protein